MRFAEAVLGRQYYAILGWAGSSFNSLGAFFFFELNSILILW